MSPTLLLTFQAIVVLVGPLLFAWWLQRRLPARWQSWGWGTLAFVASQALRMPLLIGLTLLAQGADISPERAFWLNLVVLTITAALFEETARLVVLRRVARTVRDWRECVMFGAGHGGIEAILYVGLAAINGLVLLSMGDSLLEQLRQAQPEQVEQVATQLEALRTMAWWLPLLAMWERVVAIAFHIAASLLVLRAVWQGNLWGYLAAMALHILFNALALLAQRYSGGDALLTEATITLVLPLALWIIVRARGWFAGPHAEGVVA